MTCEKLIDRLCESVMDYSFSDGEQIISVEEAVTEWLRQYNENIDTEFDDDCDEGDFMMLEQDLVSSCGRAALDGGREICQGVRCWR